MLPVLLLLIQSAPVDTEVVRPTTVLFLPLEARTGVTPDLAQLVGTSVAAAAGKLKGFTVSTWREVEGTMSQEQVRQVAGCSSTSCAAEIAGALNSDEIVLGSLGKVGSSYVLDFSRVRARDAKVLARVNERFENLNEDAILDRVPSVAAQLMGAVQPQSVVELPTSAAGHTTSAARNVLRAVGAGTLAVTGALLAGALVLGLGYGAVLVLDFAQRGFNPASTVHTLPFIVAMGTNVAGGVAVLIGLLVPLVGLASAGMLVASAVVP